MHGSSRGIPPGGELVVLENVALGYGRREVLAGLELRLLAGDFLGIVGPNGCGKTTLLKAILGILKPIRGRLHRSSEARFGYVPQRQFIDDVYPFTAMEVALMGRYHLLGPFGRPSAEDRAVVMESLEHAGIAHLADRHYRELSGGQKQRTLIARALAGKPDALILDEPTNDMDIGSEHSIMELLKRLHRRDGITVVMVSHLLNVVVNYAEKLALAGDGACFIGATDRVLTPENLSRLYGMTVEVAEHGGRQVVLAGERDD